MNVMPIHVIANGDLFREAFNAIVAVCGTSTFHTALRLAVLFAVIGVTFTYIKGRDLALLGKWFGLYFVVTIILLGPKVNVEIIDSSNQGATYTVGNVPYGLAFPASIITSVAYGLETAMEDAFHLPDDAEYSKTGMLFGSRLFKLSTGFHLVDPEVKANFNEYVKNCVLGDILLNKKYSLKTLINSRDLWGAISQAPSPIRGVLFKDGTFRTCREATPIIKQAISEDVNNSFKFFGMRIFGGTDESKAAFKLQQYLPVAYQYYADLSHSATQIMTQNILLNAMRSGVINYATEAGATAALLNLSATQAMQRMRMAWGTSRNLATYVLPVMQTDILLLMLCLFPLVILITLQPVFGHKVFKQYIYSLLWIESWPILFSCLNLAVTFYVHNKTSALAKGGLTLGNSNQLALEHSDVANMAGYLMTSIPFIAIGIVRGMSFAFNNAANYIGGMLHSTAASTANEAVTGNLSFGNTSYENVNANKFDTNATFMHGMATQQLANGATVMQTASGAQVWNAGPAISHLATNLNAGAMLSSSLSHQAEEARAAALQNQTSYNEAISDAASHLEHFNQASGLRQSSGENYAARESASFAEHCSDLHGLVQSVAERNGITWNESFKGMTSFSQGAEAHGGLKLPGSKVSGIDAGASANLRTEHTRSSDELTAHDVGTHLNVTNEEMKRFSSDLSAVKDYSSSVHAELGSSKDATELTQLAADFREAKSLSENYSSNLTESDRLSRLASFSEQHSTQINSNFNQGFAEYVQKVAPQRAAILLSNTDSAGIAAERETLANNYLHSTDFRQQLETMYQQGSSNTNPTQMAKWGNLALTANEAHLKNDYQTNAQNIQTQAGNHGAKFIEKSYNNLKEKVQANQENTNNHLLDKNLDQQSSYQNAQAKAHQDIKEGAAKADLSPVGDVLKPAGNVLISSVGDAFKPVGNIGKAAIIGIKKRSITPDFVQEKDKEDRIK